MVQIVRPTGDVAVGNWTTQDGGTTGLYAVLDETVADDADAVRSADPAAGPLEIALGDPTDPAASTGHIVRYRLGKAGSDVRNATVHLRQGSTAIASWAHTNIGAVAAYERTLAGFQADLITDYADLRLRVAGPFLPSDIAGLALWLDAAAITPVADGTAIAQWDDASGNARHAAQATGGKQPLYKPAIQNGLPAVRFDATDDCLVVPAVNLAGTAALTLFAVFGAASGTDRILVETSANYNLNVGAFLMARDTGNTISAAHHGNSATSSGITAYTTTAADAHTVPVIASAVYDYALGAGEEVVCWRNDGNRAGTKTNATVDNTDTGYGNHAINIGARNNGASVPLGGDLFEVVLYAAALSDYDRGRVEVYLNEKWDVYS